MSSNPATTTLDQDSAAAGTPVVTDLDPDRSGPLSAPTLPRPTIELDGTALEVARAAAVTEAGSEQSIGDFLVAVAEDDVAVTATFAARQAGYLGWQWSVTLAVLTAEHPTVSEVVLLPGDGALLAPAWIPWDERIRPGDLGVGDLLPPPPDDPRVVPAYLQSDDPAVEAVARELGIGRVRVLSRDGRIEFAERLHEGAFGPTDDMALAAPGHCLTCAFFLPLAGSLGRLAGACGNEYSPADGRVVDLEYGCGAHSETVVVLPARSAATDTVIDELALEVHRRPVAHAAAPEAVAEVTEAGEAVYALAVDADVDGGELVDGESDLGAGGDLGEVEVTRAELIDGAPVDAETAGSDLIDATAEHVELIDQELPEIDALDDLAEADLIDLARLDADPTADPTVVEPTTPDESGAESGTGPVDLQG